MPWEPIYRTEPSAEIGARLRQSTYEELRDEAEVQGRAMARLTADAVELYLAERRDGFEPRLAPDQPDDDQADLEFEGAA